MAVRHYPSSTQGRRARREAILCAECQTPWPCDAAVEKHGARRPKEKRKGKKR